MLAEDFTVWTAEGLSIEYLNSVLEQIRLESVKGVTLLRHGGVEVGGVLLGSREGDRIRITASRALVSEYAFGPTFILSKNDEAALEKLLQESKSDLGLSGIEPVGWYHSHTRTGVCLSEQDVSVYNRYFPEPRQVVLVLRPSQLGPTDAGFFFREADGRLRGESCYNAFTLYPSSSAPPIRIQERDMEPEVAPPQPVLHTLKAHALTQLLTSPPEEPVKPKWPWLMAATAVGALAVGVWASGVHIFGVSARQRPLDLRATDQNGQVHIQWDRSAEPVVAARRATILVQDGDRKVETPLSKDLLQHGSLMYQRKTDDVEIRLQVYGEGADTARELTRLIGLPVVPAERLEAADRTGPSPSKAGADHFLPERGPALPWTISRPADLDRAGARHR